MAWERNLSGKRRLLSWPRLPETRPAGPRSPKAPHNRRTWRSDRPMNSPAFACVSRPSRTFRTTARRSSLSGSGGRRYRDAAHAVLFYSPPDESRGLDVLDEFAQVSRGLFAGLRRAHRLLDAGDLAFEHARARQLLGVRGELRLEAAEGFELLAHERFIRLRNSRHPDEPRLFERAREIEVVSALFR